MFRNPLKDYYFIIGTHKKADGTIEHMTVHYSIFKCFVPQFSEALKTKMDADSFNIQSVVKI